jgi:hypothetical protein
MVYACIGMIIKVYRYQSGIQKLYIREGHAMQSTVYVTVNVYIL